MASPSATARIGFDAIRALRNTTGLGNYARGVLQGLHEAAPGLSLELYTPRAPVAEFAAFPAAIHATLHQPPPALQHAGLRALWRTFRLGRAAARDEVALFHGLSHELPRDLPGSGVPGVVTVHDLLFLSHPELFRTIDRQSYIWRYRWSAQHATAVIAVSRWTKQEVHRLLGVPLERIVVVPPARDPRFAAELSGAALTTARTRYRLPERFLVSVGTLEPRKNHRLALEAMALLDPALPPLALVGRDGGSEAALRRDIARLGLGDRVLLRSGVTAEDLPAVVRGASLALYLSLAEGFGLPIVEAMSAGLPVIAASGPHLRDAGGEAAVYVNPHDPRALASAIADLLLRPGDVADRIAAGRRQAAGFDSAPLAYRLLSVYDAVLERRPLPIEPARPSPSVTPFQTTETSQ